MVKRYIRKASIAFVLVCSMLLISGLAIAAEQAETTETVANTAVEGTVEAVVEAVVAGGEALEAATETINESVTPSDDEAQAEPSSLSRLEAAIAQAPVGTGEGEINPDAPRGFLNIPGAPQVNLILAFFWAIWVGWIFSTVGAFGGVMAGVGHMSVFGLGAYASSFKGTKAMNSVVTDSIRLSNQMLVGFSSLVSTFKYLSLGRVVLPLGIALGCGSLFGSFLIPWLTQGKVSFNQYQGYFGLFVLLLGMYLLYETTPAGQAKRQKGAAAAKAFEEASKEKNAPTGVKITSISLSHVNFSFCGVDFSFSTFLPVIGGFVIASIAAFLGVGGGFLLVPFLTSISQLPMYLAAGTSAFAVLVGMVTAISTFMFGGTPVFWNLIGVELVGIMIGSWVGPMTARFIPDKWLKRLFIVLAFAVGINFVLRGFTPYRLW